MLANRGDYLLLVIDYFVHSCQLPSVDCQLSIANCQLSIELERKTGLEPATYSLGSCHSTR
jgi:hypothetical protein